MKCHNRTCQSGCLPWYYEIYDQVGYCGECAPAIQNCRPDLDRFGFNLEDVWFEAMLLPEYTTTPSATKLEKVFFAKVGDAICLLGMSHKTQVHRFHKALQRYKKGYRSKHGTLTPTRQHTLNEIIRWRKSLLTE